MAADINHPVLGKLTWAADLSSWETKVELRPGCLIDLRIRTRMDVEPTHNIDELLRSGVAMLEWAKHSESACRERIADELLELYNGTWAPEGAPAPMKRAEFVKRITPSSLSRDIDGSGFRGAVRTLAACGGSMESSTRLPPGRQAWSRWRTVRESRSGLER
jgi:hypothetical protein